MAQKIIQMQMRHLYFNLKDLFSNRKGFVILTSLLNKSREFREQVLPSSIVILYTMVFILVQVRYHE